MFERFDPPGLPDAGAHEMEAVRARSAARRQRRITVTAVAAAVTLLAGLVGIGLATGGDDRGTVAATGGASTTVQSGDPGTTSTSTSTSTPTTVTSQARAPEGAPSKTSPSGPPVAFAVDRFPVFEVWAVDRDGTDRRQLWSAGYGTTTPTSSTDFSLVGWAPDGSRLAVAKRFCSGGCAMEVTLLGPGGEVQRTIRRPDVAAGVGVAWSPDSRSIALAFSDRIGVFDAATGALINDISAPRLVALTWAPGRRLTFIRPVAEGSVDVNHLYSVASDGSDLIHLTDHVAPVPPANSGDGRIAFVGRHPSSDTERTLQIPEYAPDQASSVLGPVGAALVWSYDHECVSAAVPTGDGHHEIRLFVSHKRAGCWEHAIGGVAPHLAWDVATPRTRDTPDGRLYYATGGDIWSVSRKGDDARRLTTDPVEEKTPQPATR